MSSCNKINEVYFISSSSDEDTCSLSLSQRIVQNAHVLPNKTSETSLRKHRSAHSLSDSEDTDEDERKTCEVKSQSSSDFSEASFEKKLLDSKSSYESSFDSQSVKSSETSSQNKESSSPENILPGTVKKRKVVTQTNGAKNAKAEERLKAREQKQREKALAKSLKDMEKELRRYAKPQECLKSMVIILDDHFQTISDSRALFNTFLNDGLVNVLCTNIIPFSILWQRRVAEIKMDNDQVKKIERDEQEKVLLLYIPSPEFVDKVYSSLLKKKHKPAQQTLLEYINGIQEILPDMKIICATIGLESYLRDSKTNSKSDKTESSQKNDGRLTVGKVTKKDVDEAIMELNLECCINYCPVPDIYEFASLVAKFTKAIAEAPFKLEKQQQQQTAFSWYAQADSSCPAKIDKDGTGSINLWQQQIQQFNSIGKEVAEAIAAQYPSPLSLYEAYRGCPSGKDGEKLLQDIVIRRSYGPLGTTRRVGPELSFKMYRFFMSHNPRELLQR